MSKQLLNRRAWLAGTRFVVLLAIGMLWGVPATAEDTPVILVGIVEPPQVDLETGLFVGDVARLYDVLDKLWNDPAALGLAASSAGRGATVSEASPAALRASWSFFIEHSDGPHIEQKRAAL